MTREIYDGIVPAIFSYNNIYIYIYTHLSVSDFPLNYKYDRISSSSSSIYSIYNTQLVRAVWPILAIVKYTVKSPCAFVILRYVTFFFFIDICKNKQAMYFILFFFFAFPIKNNQKSLTFE